MPETSYAYLDSPLGLIEIGGSLDAIEAVRFVDAPSREDSPSPPVQDARRQLEEYFAGRRKDFEVRLTLTGTSFQLRVWAQILAIPPGETASYQAVARAVRLTRGARAVGAAAGQNRAPILIPCHRVVGSSGGLTGYAAGLWRKEWLLRHESAILV